jgi:hypothetical protein
MNDIKKLGFWSRVRKHRTLLFIIGGIVLIAAAAITTFFLVYKKPVEKASTVPAAVAPVSVPKPIIYYSPLTGLTVADKLSTTLPVTAIMIENSPDARPQSGIKNSGVVFEAIAEGGITRFMVLYQQEKPQLIGPVRSVRLYDLDWLSAFNASIGHVGGSAEALTEVRGGAYRDIDQFFNAPSYYRSNDRYAPHNVYTTFARLDALNTAKGYTSSTFTGFSRIDATPSSTPTATKISVTISSALFNSTYSYDAKTNTYPRSQAGTPHLDRESGQIAPSVVIAMRVDETTVLQDGYREKITTIGSGKATLFQNGTAQDVTWHKTAKSAQLTFTDASGVDVALVRGQTWIVAVPNNGGAVSWQ